MKRNDCNISRCLPQHYIVLNFIIAFSRRYCFASCLYQLHQVVLELRQYCLINKVTVVQLSESKYSHNTMKGAVPRTKLWSIDKGRKEYSLQSWERKGRWNHSKKTYGEIQQRCKYIESGSEAGSFQRRVQRTKLLALHWLPMDNLWYQFTATYGDGYLGWRYSTLCAVQKKSRTTDTSFHGIRS